MFDLTVGQISGVIAAVIIVLQALFPNALAVLLVGFLQNEHNFVTWSVVQRTLLTSLWPVILQTDSSASRGVNKWVRFVTWVRPLGLVIVTIAAIVTPLGLYQDVVASSYVEYVSMREIRDTGPMGYGTPPRADEGFTRSCGYWGPLQCPGTTVVIDYKNITYGPDNSSIRYDIAGDYYDMRIPKQLAELYQSGLSVQPASVSSFFDIETRQYGYDNTTKNSTYIVDAFRYLTPVILNNKIEPVDGLIIDTVGGGIGFRHHTAPMFSGARAEWQEDLLWIEPETVCVSTNLSIEMTVSQQGLNYPQNITLVDEGGFANINHTYPHCPFEDTQSDPQLYCRAYKAAWMTNVYAMLVMNITRPRPKAWSYLKSHVGARFPLNKLQTKGATLQGLSLSSFDYSLVSSYPLTNYSLQESPGANYTNPYNITEEEFPIKLICRGAGGMDLANITNIKVGCGILYGSPYRVDGDNTLIYRPGSVYKQPIYTCASVNKASIKTVHFQYNATDNAADTLDALHVLDVRSKQYDNTAAMPLWGVETADFYLSELQQLWGLIDEDHANAVNMSTIRKPHLYLPGFTHDLSTTNNGAYYLPGLSAPISIVDAVYGGLNQPADYTGATNMALYAKWRSLSQNATSASKIVNLIWTDMAANLMTGTRGWNTKHRLPANLQKRGTESVSSTASAGSTLVPIIVYRLAVRYHWQYGIPACIALALVGIVVLIALWAMMVKRGRPSQIKQFLFCLSAGRMMASVRHPNEDNNHMPTKQWITRIGKRPCEIEHKNLELKQSYSSYNDQGIAYHNHPLDVVSNSAVAQPTSTDYHISPVLVADPRKYVKGYAPVRSEEVTNEDWYGYTKHPSNQ